MCIPRTPAVLSGWLCTSPPEVRMPRPEDRQDAPKPPKAHVALPRPHQWCQRYHEIGEFWVIFRNVYLCSSLSRSRERILSGGTLEKCLLMVERCSKTRSRTPCSPHKLDAAPWRRPETRSGLPSPEALPGPTPMLPMVLAWVWWFSMFFFETSTCVARFWDVESEFCLGR